MENPALIREINTKGIGAVLFGTTGLALWPDGPFDPHDYGWYGISGMLMLGGCGAAFQDAWRRRRGGGKRKHTRQDGRAH